MYVCRVKLVYIYPYIYRRTCTVVNVVNVVYLIFFIYHIYINLYLYIYIQLYTHISICHIYTYTHIYTYIQLYTSTTHVHTPYTCRVCQIGFEARYSSGAHGECYLCVLFVLYMLCVVSTNTHPFMPPLSFNPLLYINIYSIVLFW